MHIDEVEAIWSAIADDDDWKPFEAKVEAIRRMGEAMTDGARRLTVAAQHGVLAPPWPKNWCRPSRRPARNCGRARSATPPPRSLPRAPPGRNGRRIRSPIASRRCAASPTSSASATDEFADLISRETGKPLWEAKTEVGAVINKVEISIDAYAERTPHEEAGGGARQQGRGPPQAARRAGGARAVSISPRICPTATSSRR